MKTANSFVRGHRRRIATAWLFVCAGTAIGGEPTRTGEDQADPRASQIEIVAIDSVSQRAAIRFDDDREPRPLVVGGAAARDLRLISVRGDLVLLEYTEPESKAPVLLQVRQGALARLRAVPKLSTETTVVIRLPDMDQGDHAKFVAKPSSDSRAGRRSSNAE